MTSLFIGATLGAAILAIWQVDEEPAHEEHEAAEPVAATPPEPPTAPVPPPDDPPRQGLWSRGLPG